MRVEKDLANKTQRLLKLLRSMGIIFSLISILMAVALSIYIVTSSLSTSFIYQSFIYQSAALTTVIVLLISAGLGTGAALSFWWTLIFLAVFPIPLAIIIVKKIRAGTTDIRATFLIWSGLGGMLTVMLGAMFSIGVLYFPIYLSIMIIAFIIEFIRSNAPIYTGNQ